MNLFHPPAALVETLGWVLVHSVWQLALTALVALLVARAMRRCSARTRYGMLTVALAMMTAAPIATLLVLEPSPPTAAMRYDLRMAEYAKRLKETLGVARRFARDFRTCHNAIFDDWRRSGAREQGQRYGSIAG